MFAIFCAESLEHGSDTPMTGSVRQTAEGLARFAQRIAGLDPSAHTQCNLSVRDRDSGDVVITPHDISFGTISADDMVTLNLAGDIVDGQHKPTQATAVHLTVYRERPDVHAILHTEPIYINTLGGLVRPIPPVMISKVLAPSGNSAIMSFNPGGSNALGVEMLLIMGDRKAIVWAEHGSLTIGPGLEAALRVAVALEGGARTAYLASVLGPPNTLSLTDLIVPVG